jgi:hypothetical protein
MSKKQKQKREDSSTSTARIGPFKETGNGISLSRDALAERAYFLFLNEGSPSGRDVDHWLEAEAQVEAEACGIGSRVTALAVIDTNECASSGPPTI